MTIHASSIAALTGLVGQRATGQWLEIGQDRIQAFADATEDHQWIHIDAEKAASGPFGTTIAHGYLTLSLLPKLTEGLIVVDGIAMAMNYGLDRVRFLQPVPAGSRIRAQVELTGVEETAMGVRASFASTVEIDGVDKPALAATFIALFVPSV